jgi:uncharacterized protein YutE (UPF0331/DUF86 family)
MLCCRCLLSAHFGAVADDYEDILEKLGRHGVIDSELRQELAGLGGFRNVLVHGYLDLDRDRVAEAHRKAPELFGLYRLQVERWLGEVWGK